MRFGSEWTISPNDGLLLPPCQSAARRFNALTYKLRTPPRLLSSAPINRWLKAGLRLVQFVKPVSNPLLIDSSRRPSIWPTVEITFNALNVTKLHG